MFYSTNQSYHWKLNQSEVVISGRLANQIVRIQPIRRGVTCNTSASEQYIHFLHFFPHFFFFRFFHFSFYFSFHFFFSFFFIFLISVLLFLIYFFIQHFQQVTAQQSVQWLSLPRDFLRAWWLINCSFLVYFSWTFYL